MGVLGAGLTAALVAALASLLVLRFLAERMIDVPSERSSHETPTPRGGGISIIAGVGAGLIAAQAFEAPILAAFLIALSLGAVGLLEDWHGIPIWTRLSPQVLVVALGLRWVGAVWIEERTWFFVVVVLLFCWMIGYINAFNFMDGINGISGAQMIVAGTAWIAAGSILELNEVRLLGSITIGAAAGFLPWNLPRARFFMGDTGSYFSGAWLASVTIIGIRAGVPEFVMVAPMLVYVADSSFTLIGRVVKGEPFLIPHRQHVYQRLVVGGWSHEKTTLFYTAIAAIVAVSSMLWMLDTALSAAAAIVLTALAILTYMTTPVLLARGLRE